MLNPIKASGPFLSPNNLEAVINRDEQGIYTTYHMVPHLWSTLEFLFSKKEQELLAREEFRRIVLPKDDRERVSVAFGTGFRVRKLLDPTHHINVNQRKFLSLYI